MNSIMISSKIKNIIKSSFNKAGFDIIRRENSPAQTLLGLQSRPIQTIIDVGANTGQFAREVSGFFPNAKLYCFEPLPAPFEALSAWAQTQHGRVVPLNLAIGEKEGEVEMFLHKDHTPSSSLLTTTKLNEQYYPFTKEQKRISVRQTTLDTALYKVQVEFLPELLIKLDVQGFEDRVIAGGSNTFAKASACILEILVDKLYDGQSDFKELLMKLDNLGFQYVGNLNQAYGKDGHCIFLDAVFLRRS